MTNVSSILRSLITYALVLPLAAVLGYLLATPLDFSTLSTIGLVLLFLCIPLILRWHFHLLIMSWNTFAVLFFLPGRPRIWLVTAFVSLLISAVRRTFDQRMRFLPARTIISPLLFLAGVVFITAQMTGGMGMRIFGSAAIGGLRYLLIFGAIVGFMAMTAVRIPPPKAKLFVGLFLLSTMTNVFGSLAYVVPSFMYPMFLLFPAEAGGLGSASAGSIGGSDITRTYFLSQAGQYIFIYMLSRHGIREALDTRKPGRMFLFLATIVCSMYGGFRSVFILVGLTFMIIFYLEGLLRTKFLPIFILVGILGVAALIPMATRLPLSVQRSMSFLPIEVDPIARENAEATSQWRLDMWKSLLPEIPKYLIVGKGLAIDSNELDTQHYLERRGASFGGAAGSILAGDYHSGPLSIIIPFGIFGLIGFVWLLIAEGRGLYRNYLYGDPALRKVNTVLYAMFLARTFLYVFIFGGFYTDLAFFAGLMGFSISLNGGICKPVMADRPQMGLRKSRLAPVLAPAASRGGG